MWSEKFHAPFLFIVFIYNEIFKYFEMYFIFFFFFFRYMAHDCEEWNSKMLEAF